MGERLTIRPGITIRPEVLPQQFEVQTLAGRAVLTRVQENLPSVTGAATAYHWVWEIETGFLHGSVSDHSPRTAIHYGVRGPWVEVGDALDGLEMLVSDWIAKNPDLAERALGERRGVSYV